MKKLKKFLAGVVTLAMAMSMMTMTAFATETTQMFDGSGKYEGQKLSTSTINGSAKGSLTIHKFEYNGTETIKGTGAAKDATPTGSKPLAGAGFTIYKVEDLSGMTQYYNEEPVTLPAVDSYLNDDGTVNNPKWTSEEKTTGTDGIVKFENLDLGFYVVIETTTPPAVTDAMDPFIISVPMTTAEGDAWLYDIHAFPKNGTKYAPIDLLKVGNDGTTGLDGVTFKLEKLVGDKWEPITRQSSASGDNTGDDLNLTTSNGGKIHVAGLSQGTYRFIETDRGNNDGYIMDGKTAYEFEVTDKGTVIYNSVESSESTTITITVKNEKPDFGKEIQKRDGAWVSNEESKGGAADYSVGDLVPYKLTIDVPGNITELKTFKVTDVPTNLKDWVGSNVPAGKTDTLKVTIGSADGADVDTNAYSVLADEKGGFTITFTPANMSAYAGKKIVVTYKAELLSTAVTNTTGNPNTATLEYSNKILPDSSVTPSTDKIEDTTRVYTFEVQILKVDESGSNPLEGVKFDLYKLQGNDVAVTESPISDTLAAELGLPTDSNQKWVKVNTTSLSTNSQGKVNQKGLANGTYYLVETETNAGYNLLKAPVLVTLSVTYEVTTKQEWTVDEAGNKTLVKHEVTKKTFDGAENATGVYETKVINKKGFTLPTTGGMGTFVFTFVGVAMMAAAVILFLTSKKKEAK